MSVLNRPVKPKPKYVIRRIRGPIAGWLDIRKPWVVKCPQHSGYSRRRYFETYEEALHYVARKAR